jgi:hypothetical protein
MARKRGHKAMKKMAWLVVGVFALCPALARAQDDPNRGPLPVPTGGSSTAIAGEFTNAPEPDPAGSSRGATFVAPSKFTAQLTAGSPVLAYSSFHYYNSPGSTSPVGYFAQVDVPAGGLIDGFTCIFNDGSATNDVSYSLQKYSTNFAVSPPTRAGAFLASGASTGSAGVGFDFVTVSPTETVSIYDGVNLVSYYYLRADVATDTSFGGCYVWWKRQVKAGPATATFTDVPTTNGQFKFVQSLVAAGITGGCGASTYCPNDPVTRGQMAVFLSVALGLNYPY